MDGNLEDWQQRWLDFFKLAAETNYDIVLVHERKKPLHWTLRPRLDKK